MNIDRFTGLLEAFTSAVKLRSAKFASSKYAQLQ